MVKGLKLKPARLRISQRNEPARISRSLRSKREGNKRSQRPWVVSVVGPSSLRSRLTTRAALLCAASEWPRLKKPLPALQRGDAWIGDLSYPVYLFHYQVGFLIVCLGLAPVRGWALFWWALPVLVLLAAVMAAASTKTVDRLRATIRGQRVPAKIPSRGRLDAGAEAVPA
jgi:peptidoglycan/LPS O-acetylase OafA/YrhL